MKERLSSFDKKKPERSDSEDRGPSETIRSLSAPRTDIDEAVARFIALTREGETRRDAFEEVTKEFETKKIQDFTDALGAAEKTAASAPVFATKRRESPREKVQRERIISALRVFHQQAIMHGSDMRHVFDQVSHDMKLTPHEQAALAREVMSAVTPRDLPQDESPEDTTVQEIEASDTALSPNARLIPAEAQIERLNESAKTPEDLKNLIRSRLRAGNSRIRLNPDGTAEVVGQWNAKGKGRRGRNRNRGN